MVTKKGYRKPISFEHGKKLTLTTFTVDMDDRMMSMRSVEAMKVISRLGNLTK